MAYQKVSLLYSHTIHNWLFPFAALRFVPTKLKRSAFFRTIPLSIVHSLSSFLVSVCKEEENPPKHIPTTGTTMELLNSKTRTKTNIWRKENNNDKESERQKEREREREVRQSIRKTIMEYKVKHCINEHLGLCQFFNFFFLSSVALCFDSVYSFGLLPSSVDSHCSHFIYASVWYAQQPVKIEWISND